MVCTARTRICYWTLHGWCYFGCGCCPAACGFYCAPHRLAVCVRSYRRHRLAVALSMASGQSPPQNEGCHPTGTKKRSSLEISLAATANLAVTRCARDDRSCLVLLSVLVS